MSLACAAVSEKLRPASFSERGLVDEQPRGLDLGRHVGELGLDRLELGDRLAERAPLLGVGERLVERALREADAHRRDADPPDVEHLQELLEAAAARAEQVLLRARGSPRSVSGRVSEAFQPILRYGSPCS